MKTLLSIILFLSLSSGAALAQAFNDFEVYPHDYYEGVADDPMIRLMVRAESGNYDFGTETGLPLLKKLCLPGIRSTGIPSLKTAF